METISRKELEVLIVKKTCKKRYWLHVSHCIENQQVNRTRIIYRSSDEAAKKELIQIHDTDNTAHEGFVTRECGNQVVGEFCKYV
ncbi:hypothetical protein A2V71_02415 [Candidatus Berkelbacteria bacterium RBG_13_40_8]|uniref:Uncharacterized protein n=1 Tax=Candidatus Berkelbacteria bacterium RBG_13_40_8 TaxID=1797467 RepID=A0A1F5DN95_9BACT|nr:MAG: hypothetical protein A2V71_02415 [Candidatus Berkelbacteria bacterium RBG_13_40_8]